MHALLSKRTFSQSAWMAFAALLLLTASHANAVVSLVNFDSQTFTGPTSTGAFNFTVANNPDRLLLVGLQLEKSSAPPVQMQTLTYGGQPLMPVKTQLSVSGQETSELWYLLNPPVGNASLSATLSSSTETGRGFRLTAFDIAGAAQIMPIGGGSSDQSNAISTAVFAPVANSLLVGLTHNQGAGGSHTPGLGVTELYDADAVSVTAAAGYKVATLGGPNVFEWTQVGGGGIDVQSVAAIAPADAPAPPMMLNIDFNARSAAGNTQPGFDPFVLDTPVGATTARVFSGVTATLTHTNGGTVDDRIRTQPTNSGSFTTAQLLQDFVFAQGNTAADGLNLRFDGLVADTDYLVTVYSFDDGSGGARTSDWFANGILVEDDYSFDGNAVPPSPANDDVYAFTFTAATTPSGVLEIRGLAAGGANPNVFPNAITLSQIKPPVPEPATATLALLSLGALVRRRRRA